MIVLFLMYDLNRIDLKQFNYNLIFPRDGTYRRVVHTRRTHIHCNAFICLVGIGTTLHYLCTRRAARRHGLPLVTVLDTLCFRNSNDNSHCHI